MQQQQSTTVSSKEEEIEIKSEAQITQDTVMDLLDSHSQILQALMKTSGKMQEDRQQRKTILIKQKTMDLKRHSMPVPEEIQEDDPESEMIYERPQDFEEDKDDLVILQTKQKVEMDNSSQCLQKVGIVEKKSPSFFKGWQKRVLELKQRTLSYSKVPKEEIPRGSIDFDKCEATVERVKDNRFEQVRYSDRIKLKGVARTFEFRTKNVSETEEWVRKISKSIKNSKGNCDNLKIVGSKFWKGKTIREEELLEHAQTGDILLFRSKSFNSKMQRSFTRSYYDHVGMLMHFKDLGLYLFEATLNDGVGLTSWSELRPYVPQIYHRVAYRRLNMERTPARMKRLEAFLHEAYGKQYHISFRKLMQRKSVVGPNSSPSDSFSSDSSLAQDRTFFCSELVAKAFKEMGILITEKASCQFWPVSFTQRKELPFVENISLGEQFAVSVDLDSPVPRVTNKQTL